MKLFERPLALKPFLPPIGMAAVILALSINPGIQLPEVGLSADKFGHFLAYGLLSWLTLRAIHQTGRLSRRLIILAILGVSGYGILLELVQWAFFPYRFFEWWDMVANFIGSIAGLFAFRLFITKTERHGF